MWRSLQLLWVLISCCSAVNAQTAVQPAWLQSVGQWATHANDLRVAAESFAQGMIAMERVAMPMLETLEAISANHAAMSRDFDPFGFKESQKTLQMQLAIITAQQQAMRQNDSEKAKPPSKSKAKRKRSTVSRQRKREATAPRRSRAVQPLTGSAKATAASVR